MEALERRLGLIERAAGRLAADQQMLEDLQYVVGVGGVDEAREKPVAFAERIHGHGKFEAAGAVEAAGHEAAQAAEEASARAAPHVQVDQAVEAVGGLLLLLLLLLLFGGGRVGFHVEGVDECAALFRAGVFVVVVFIFSVVSFAFKSGEFTEIFMRASYAERVPSVDEHGQAERENDQEVVLQELIVHDFA